VTLTPSPWRFAQYCVIPDALSTGELQEMREAFDQDRRDNQDCWGLRGQSRDGDAHWSSCGGEVGERGRWQTEPLVRTRAFDRCIWHPKTFPLLSRLMGRGTMRLVHLSAMSRDPVADPAPEGMPDNIHWQLWHREGGGSFAPDHPFCLETTMVLYYLDDCTAGSHCFSVVPESLAEKQRLPWRMEPIGGARAAGRRAVIDQPFTERMWRNRPGSMMSDEVQDGVGRPDGIDCVGPAGTAIVTNACNIHAGTVRQSPRPRRSIILWWTHGPQKYPEPVRHSRGLPNSLTEHPWYGFLFSQKPLNDKDRWLTLGRKPAATEARL
jgi:hypothetical protein